MSRRSSAGDLVPRDISEILAREGKAQRGQKKPGGSLGQAFNWLKGSRKKKSISNGQSRTGIGATDGKPGHQNHDPAKAGPKGNEDQKRLTVHYTASQHYQENVFMEGSRPQYLEELHIEAQEGLKIQQQEEHKNGGTFPDDESIASADTVRPEQDVGSKDRSGSPESGITTGNSVTTATSAVSAVSTRPVLTRQGSTFKPLNPVKSNKNKKRTRRTTIMGIPQQVQRELALHRTSTFQQIASTQLPNGDDQSGVVIIPTIDGDTPVANQEGARVHLSDLEASREEQLLRQHLQAVYQEEQAFSHQGLGYRLSPTSSQRPKSVAVPGMTTCSSSAVYSFLQEPQGPVMSISPQATYLSKIIPNAVLPASVDVIQIDRSSSRTRASNGSHGGSVRTVSKSSLASGDSSASPASSRRSEGDADSSHNNSMAIPTTASGSNWSQSQSSETIISSTSAISSKGNKNISNPQTVGLAGQESQPKQPVEDQDHVSLQSSVSWASGPSIKSGSLGNGQRPESGISGSVSAGEVSSVGQESKRSSQSFTRSLSIMKTKQPPAPPRRTNSLHNNKMIRGHPRELVDIKDSVFREAESSTDNSLSKEETCTKPPAPVSNSAESTILDDSRSSASSGPLSPTQASSGGAGGSQESQSESSSSSPQKTPTEGGKFERTMSPSSGYSSQSGTPTLSPKGISPTSPVKQKKKPVKPERSGSRASSSAASASSSLTSLSSSTSETVNQETPANSPTPPQQGSPPPVAAMTEKATPVNYSPSPSMAIRELFNIPPPPKVKAPCPPPPETWAYNRRTLELLCGPCPNVNRLNQLQNAEQSRDNIGRKTQTVTSNESPRLVEKETTVEEAVLPPIESKERVSQDKPETFLETVPECVGQEIENMESPSTEQASLPIPEREEVSVDVQRQEKDTVSVVKDKETQGTMPKKEPPPVMKKPTLTSRREDSASAERSEEGQQQAQLGSVTIEVHSPIESSSQTEVEVLVDKSEVEVDRCEDTTENIPGGEPTTTTPQPPMQTLSVDPPKVDKISPPPSPPPAYHPTPPPSRKTPPSSVSTPPSEEIHGVQEEIVAVESCWPPPPPPLEGDSVFDGVDEMDFPPPPPPFTPDSLPDVVDSCITELDVTDRPVVAPEEVHVTMKDATGAGKTLNEENADLPSTMAQTVVEESRTDKVIESTESNTADQDMSDVALQEASSLPEGVPPPPIEAPPPPPMTDADMSNSALLPPSSAPLPPPLQSEDPTLPEPPVSAPLPPPITVPLAPVLPTENQSSGVNFRRQPSLANRDTRSKEILSRHKSASIPKEDANIPLVTPSLLQMVRLRSVNVGEDQMKAPSEDINQSSCGSPPAQDNCPVSTPGSQHVPQKPIRKSLSLKSPPPTLKTSSVTMNAPSMRLQEAIRMKTAAMSSKDSLPARLGMRSSISSSSNSLSEAGVLPPKSPEGGDMHKTPASTASFIFSRSTKKVVIETPVASSPEAQASLKQSLAAELMQISDQSKATALSNGGVKPDKVPPPVAKKPAQGSSNPSQKLPVCSAKTEVGKEANGTVTSTTVTPDTIETLF